MEAQKTIFIVDDHPIVRQGLRELLPKLGPYRVGAEFEDGQDFIDNLNTGDLPDLVLLDLSMPRMSGIEVLKTLQTKNIKLPVLILSLNSEEQQIVQTFRLGARGYLDKNSKADPIRSALEDIFRSGYHHNEFMRLSLESSPKFREPMNDLYVLEKMTAREKEFLKLVCHEKEYTYEQVADLMQVGLRTVEGYRLSLFEKFGIKSKTGLVLFVLKHKLYDHL